jgi:CheY-like chemotaxis protein
MNSNKYNILVIDDDTIYQYTAKKTIEAIGLSANISFCSNGEEALDYIESSLKSFDLIPDVILLDVNMPVMNGWDFLKAYNKIKNKINKKITIYVVSSSEDESDIENSRKFEIVEGYMVKPILKEQFSQILSTLYA